MFLHFRLVAFQTGFFVPTYMNVTNNVGPNKHAVSRRVARITGCDSECNTSKTDSHTIIIITRALLSTYPARISALMMF